MARGQCQGTRRRPAKIYSGFPLDRRYVYGYHMGMDKGNTDGKDLLTEGRTMARRRDRYVAVHPDGSVERMSVPTWVTGPFELAARAPHTLVFLLVPKARKVWDKASEQFIPGPAAMLVKDDELYYAGASPPASDGAAYHVYRELSAAGAF